MPNEKKTTKKKTKKTAKEPETTETNEQEETEDQEMTDYKGTITVTSSLVEKGEIVGEEEVEQEFIDVEPFFVEPAKVRVCKGLTLNLGNYQSARVDVDITRPVYKEEIGPGLDSVNRLVEARLAMEVDSIMSMLKNKKVVK